MTKTKFLFLILFSSIVLYIYNLISIKLHLFFVSPILDSPSHTLGGFIVALVFSFVAFDIFKEKRTRFLNLYLFLGVLGVGILWEIFEVKYNITFPYKKGYWADTISDIFCDLLGAFIAYLYPIKKLYSTRP